MNQTHEVAQQVAPESRIVYVDNDPIVIAQAHELLRSTTQGATAFHRGDLRDPGPIIEHADEMLDFTQPVALMLVAIYHMIADSDDPWAIHAQYVDPLPAGSWVVLSHLTSDFVGSVWDQAVETPSDATREPFTNRSHDEFSGFFDGLDLVPPGVVPIDDWLRDGPAPLQGPPQPPAARGPAASSPRWTSCA